MENQIFLLPCSISRNSCCQDSIENLADTKIIAEISIENEFEKLFHEYDSCIELGMSKDIQAFLEGRDDIKDYSLEADESQKILININLKNFSKLSAKKLFSEFVCFVGYNGINLYICDNTEQQIKYKYLTVAVQDPAGVKMEIVIG